MARKLVLILSLFLILTNNVFAAGKPQRYMPYPIIFVSGIRTSLNSGSQGYPSNNWPDRAVFKELGKYFLVYPGDKNKEAPKYIIEGSLDKGEKSHLEFFFYDARQATLATNADLLKDEIIKVINKGGYYNPDTYIYTDPCSTPKVILVCHSLGGLIARYMLVNHTEMQDKVAAVFFIGSQQEGSPIGVAAYFLPKEILALRKDIDDIDSTIDGSGWLRKRTLLNVKERELSKITGNLRLMRWAENEGEVFYGRIRDGLYATSFPGLYVSTRDSNDNDQLRTALGNTFENDWRLPKVTEKGVVKGTLIYSDSANSYRHTFTAYSFNGPFGTGVGAKVVRSVPKDGPLTYGLSEAVFSDPATDRNIGNVKAYAIAGNCDAVLRDGFYMAANTLMGWDNFNSLDYSCISNGFWNGGDGFANLASQKAIVPVANAHEIPASHISFPSTPGELDYTGTPDIILQAIDDKPVIDNVWIIRLYDTSGNYLGLTYLVVKVKDYLLADVEFKLDGINAQNLDEYLDPVTGAYKPYLKGKENKEFLKERDVLIGDEANNTITSMHLLPGEFYLKIFDSYPAGSIKIKNPADKETECRIVYSTGIFAKFKYYVTVMDLTRSQYPPYEWITGLGEWALPYSAFRGYAYNSFLSFPIWFSTDDNEHLPVDMPRGGISANIHGYGWWDVSSFNGYPIQARRTLIAYMEDNHFINFPLDTSGKTIRTAKFSGYLHKELNGGGADFNMDIYRDSTNTWPTTQNSSADIPLFSIDTSLYQDRSYFETPIDTANINPNGNNVWETRSGLMEFALHNNFLPESIPNDLSYTYLGPSMWAHFKRSAYISFPVLIIIYE